MEIVLKGRPALPFSKRDNLASAALLTVDVGKLCFYRIISSIHGLGIQSQVIMGLHVALWKGCMKFYSQSKGK